MWLGKFLDLSKDVKALRAEIKKSLFADHKKKKLTPLEFTIVESIFNREISGYDLLDRLNKHFAGTWKASSGTVYPILSKLKRYGFLKAKAVKSPIGPLKTVYALTEAGETLLKNKINKNFADQLKFIENFLIELSSIYAHSLKEGTLNDNVALVRNLIREAMENVMNGLNTSAGVQAYCPECKAELKRPGAKFCPLCSASLSSQKQTEDSEFDSTQNLNSKK